MIRVLIFILTATCLCGDVLAQIANGRYAILSRHSGLGLDVASASQDDGANVQQWSYNARTHQQFDVANLGNGYYSIRAVHSGKSLDVYAFSTDPGGEIRQWTYWGGENQQWQITGVGSGYYTITSRWSGLNLDVWEWSTASGGDIRQWTSSGGYNQQWSFVPVSGNSSGCPLNHEGFAAVSGGITGGGNVAATTVTNLDQLRACATVSGARVCRVQGTINFSNFEEIRVTSNKTIIGAGTSGHIVNGGFFLGAGVNNVIIRNLTIRDSFVEGDWAGDTQDNDGVQMDTAHHIWIDHNRFSRLGDGMIDSRMDTTYLTVSWNILEEHNKTFGIGWTDNVTAQMTIHHNWFHNTNQRNPAVDNVLRAHLFNNLLENVDSYGNHARGNTNMVLQNSVFINVNDPHYYDNGTLVAMGNSYQGTSGQAESTGSTFSAFNPGNYYSYTLHPTSQVANLVRSCAGPRAELGN